MGLVNAFYGTLTIAGTDYGPWDAFAGGEYDTEETKYTPYDGVQRTYLGNRTVGNVTLTRDYRPARDGVILRNKDSLQDAPFVFTVQDKDSNGNFQQNRPPYTGFVKMITPPEGDSDGSDVAKISIELSTGQVAS